jgi:Icc protein
MRILQLSDPHLLADPEGLVRERPALSLWQRALAQVRQTRPHLLLVTGDLCQDESWGG